MGNWISLFYALIFVGAGFLLARRLAPTLRREQTLVLAGAFALCLLEGLPALFALLLGFRLPAAMAALLAAAALCAGLLRAKKPTLPGRGSRSFWWCLLPLLLVTWALLCTHTLHWKAGAYWSGQSTYGDLPMHLAFISSIARQGAFPPRYSLLAGQTVFGYPFLCETVSSVFLLLGAELRFAVLLPAFLAVFTSIAGVWWLGQELLGCGAKAGLSAWLFCVGSGFGFAYFMGGGKENFLRIFTEFYQTPTNYVQENIRWVNPIADMVIPQRATLFGWALLFPCLAVLARFVREKDPALWPALALLAAPLPLVHTHSALALVLVCAVLFAREVWAGPSLRRLRPWLLFAGCTALLWLPQLFGVIFQQTTGGSGFLRFHFNWANEGDNYFWFYIKNMGLLYLLLLPAFLWAKKDLRWFYGGGLLILAVSEVILFQPNPYDNNKLLFVWYLLGCVLIANLLVDLARMIPQRSVRVALAALTLAASMLGGVLTLGREAVSSYRQFDPDAIAAAEFVEEHTEPEALFLTGRQHLNPVASLAGANILCGSSLYVHFHGMDYHAQEEAARRMYEQPDRALLEQWGVDYVMISGWERSDYALEERWFYENLEPVFCQGQFVIFRV